LLEEVNEIRSNLENAEESYNDIVVAEVVRACRVAEKLSKDKGEWLAFCEDECWQGRGQPPTADQQAKALRFVLRAVCGKGNYASQNASLYYRAVRPLVEEGIDLDDLAEAIKEARGLRALADANVRAKSDNPPESATAPEKRAAPKITNSPRVEAREEVDRARPMRRGSASKQKAARDELLIIIEATMDADVTSILQFRTGTRFSMEATLDEAGDPCLITINRVERLNRPSRQ
jgi:hypothetical protein